jgi:hypothetical protein
MLGWLPNGYGGVATYAKDIDDVFYLIYYLLREQDRLEQVIKELEAQIKRLREIHQRREQQKDRIVADRLQQLLRDADGLGWGTEDAGPVGRELRLPLNFDRARLDGDWTKKRELFEITRPGADSALPPPGDPSRDR